MFFDVFIGRFLCFFFFFEKKKMIEGERRNGSRIGLFNFGGGRERRDDSEGVIVSKMETEGKWRDERRREKK